VNALACFKSARLCLNNPTAFNGKNKIVATDFANSREFPLGNSRKSAKFAAFSG
jgi:hypothetical protein